MKKITVALIIGVICAASVNMMPMGVIQATATENNAGEDDDIDTTPATTSEFVMVGGNWITPRATYGRAIDIVLPVVNMGSTNLTNVIVTPVVSGNQNEWPFEIHTSGYSQTIPELPAKGNGQSDMDRRRELTWTMQVRNDALNGYYKLQFSVIYQRGTISETATLTTWVYVNGAPGSGNVSDGAKLSTPRVIVTGFDTTPAEVKAGDTFTLVLHLKNTSQRTAVSNMAIGLKAAIEGTDTNTTYAAFLPTSGSNTVYIDRIGRGASTDVTIEMTAKSDLLQKPYVLDVTMDFEDEQLNSYSGTANVSIPIKQDSKFDVSTPEIMPPDIQVGNETNVMFNIYNTGKTTLYNVQVKFEAPSVEGGEVFVGRIEAGGTGMVDAMVRGIAPTMDDGTVKVVISYEDESGNLLTYEENITIFVTEAFYDDMGDGMMIDEMPPETGGGGVGKVIIIIVIIVVVLAGGVVVFLLLRKKKKKKEENELVNLLDEFEGEDDTDEIS